MEEIEASPHTITTQPGTLLTLQPTIGGTSYVTVSSTLKIREAGITTAHSDACGQASSITPDPIHGTNPFTMLATPISQDKPGIAEKPNFLTPPPQ